ncbi:MAG: mechanosensitive ion channel domain-containing protein [Pseudomonadota bacterium]
MSIYVKENPLKLFLIVLMSCWLVTSMRVAFSEVTDVSNKAIDAFRQTIESDAALEEATQKVLFDKLKVIEQLLEQGQLYQNQTKQSVNNQRNIAKILKKEANKTEKNLAAIKTVSENTYRNKSAEQLNQLLIIKRVELTSLKQVAENAENRVLALKERPSKIQKSIIEDKTHELELEEAILNFKNQADLNRSQTIELWSNQAELKVIQSRLTTFNNELATNNTELEIASAVAKTHASALSEGEAHIAMIEAILDKQRQDSIEQAKTVIDATKGESDHPILRKAIKTNEILSEHVTTISHWYHTLPPKVTSTEQEAKRLAIEYENIKKQLDLAGFTQVFGQQLFKRQAELPSLPRVEQTIQENDQKIIQLSLSQINHEKQLDNLLSVDDFMLVLFEDLGQEDLLALSTNVRRLLDSRKSMLDQAIDLETSLINSLNNYNLHLKRLLSTLELYYQLINEKALWIRNSQAFSSASFMEVPEFWQQRWQEITDKSLLQKTRLTAVEKIVLGLVVIFALCQWLWKNKIMALMIDAGKFTKKISKDNFSNTLLVFFLSWFRATPIPLLLVTLGWSLKSDDNHLFWMHALSSSLILVAPLLFGTLGIYTMMAPQGLVARHFFWPEVVVNKMRRIVFLAATSPLSLYFLHHFFFQLDSNYLGSTVHLGIFLVLTLILARLTHQLFEPSKGVLTSILYTKQPSSKSIYRRIFQLLNILIPSVLIAVSLAGYTYAADELILKFYYTLWVLLTGVLFYHMAKRWLTLSSKKIALQRALERRQQLKNEQEEEKTEEETLKVTVDEEDFDLETINQNTLQLVAVLSYVVAFIGLWLVWQSVVPAFKIFDQYELWSRVIVVDNAEQIVPVTLGDGLFALLIALIVYFATQKVPALLEISLLQKLEVTPGGRYAIKMLVNYAVIIIGFIWISNILGISWNKIQWLVAALGVGIGFGLQEIIANFISGIIILFERPIRVGDIVTTGDTDGVVTRIQIRATTIRTWDRKELLVPNKEFVTGRLLNWSLSDTVVRIYFPVGIAYGSDVDKAMHLIEKIAMSHERVLTEPTPLVTFESFGDNCLMIYLRCYVSSTDHRLTTLSELHKSINDTFNREGIEISFPQRDVHLDTISPLKIELLKPNTAKTI